MLNDSNYMDEESPVKYGEHNNYEHILGNDEV